MYYHIAQIISGTERVRGRERHRQKHTEIEKGRDTESDKDRGRERQRQNEDFYGREWRIENRKKFWKLSSEAQKSSFWNIFYILSKLAAENQGNCLQS